MRLWRRIRQIPANMSFRGKLVLALVFVIILPTFAVELAIMAAMRSQALDYNTQGAVGSAAKTEQQLQEMFKQVVDVSNMLYVDPQLLNIVSKRYISSWEVVNAMRHYTGFNYYQSYYPQIKAIRFYISTSNLLGEYNYVDTTKQLENYPWYWETMERGGLVSWNYTFNENESQPSLSLTRLVRNFEGVDVGVLVIELNKSYMSRFLGSDNFQTLLADERGLILAANNEEYLGKSMTNIGYEETEALVGENIHTCVMNGEASISTVNRFRVNMFNEDLSIISIFPRRRIIEEANSAIFWYLMIIIASELLAALLIVVLSGRMAGRIRTLSDEIHKVASGDLKTEISVDGGDEIGQLSKDLRIMKQSLNELIEVAYISELQKKQMELMEKENRYNMLVSQLNPHFLFNALETIRMKAVTDRNHEVSRYVMVLGKILRMSLSMESFIPLSREIEFVTNYLTFQMFRFSNKMEYRITLGNVDPDTVIIPYLIQPVVENSIIHGIETKRRKCLVRVSMEEREGDIAITVSDNGKGMDEVQLDRMWQSIVSDTADRRGKSIGLHNVYHRIKLYYGEKYGLTVESRADTGTSVTIRIPARFDQEGRDRQTKGDDADVDDSHRG